MSDLTDDARTRLADALGLPAVLWGPLTEQEQAAMEPCTAAVHAAVAATLPPDCGHGHRLEAI